jgi:hypothetical protein
MRLAQLSCARVKSYSRHTLERLKTSGFLQAGIFIFGYDHLRVGIVGRAMCLLSLASHHHRRDKQEDGDEERLHNPD